MGPLDLVNLTRLMERTSGRAEIKVALIDGLVGMKHPDLAAGNIREVPGKLAGACSRASSAACMHGTFVAECCARSGARMLPPFAPVVPCLYRPFLRNRRPRTETCQAPYPKNSPWPSLRASRERRRVFKEALA
jgi:hypothetical protein